MFCFRVVFLANALLHLLNDQFKHYRPLLVHDEQGSDSIRDLGIRSKTLLRHRADCDIITPK